MRRDGLGLFLRCALALALASCKRTCGETVGAHVPELEDGGGPSGEGAAAGKTTGPRPGGGVDGGVDSEKARTVKWEAPPAAPPGPRPIAPMSGARTTTKRPTLRWLLPPGAAGATVELCRDRACGTVDQVIETRGTTASPQKELAEGIWYWRVRAPASPTGGELRSATWEFGAPARSTPVDTSIVHGADLDGDGYDDVVADAYVFKGGPSGLPTRPSDLLPSYSPDDCVLRDDGMIDQCAGPTSDVARLVGDVNGDGFADVILAAGAGGDDEGAALYFGDADGLSPMRASADVGNAEPLGDVDGDGYSDVASVTSAGSVAVDFGGPAGFDGARRVTLRGARASAAGDVNGDGFADVLLDRGDDCAVYVGGPSGLSTSPMVVPVPSVDAPRDATGASAASAPVFVGGGDMNGDGYSDVAIVRNVHNPYMKDAFDYRTHFWLFLGWRGGIAAVPYPQMARTWYGRRHTQPKETVVVMSDVDGDGFADLVGSDVGLDGDLFLLEGGPGGPSSGPRRIAKGDGKLWFGYPRAAGDVNGDGFDDILVRSTDDILGHPHVWLYRGFTHGLPREPSSTWYFFPRL